MHCAAAVLAAMFIDIDQFKQINDSHGHAEDDKVLIEFAVGLRRWMTDTDYVSRLSGYEFVMMVHGLVGEQSDAMVVANKILCELGKPSNLIGMTQAFSSSIGISMHLIGNTTAEILLKRADTAMYDAKRGGAGRIHCFDV